MKAKFKVGDKVRPASNRGQRIWKSFFGNAKSGKVVRTMPEVGFVGRNGYEVQVGIKIQPMYSYELEKV